MTADHKIVGFRVLIASPFHDGKDNAFKLYCDFGYIDNNNNYNIIENGDLGGFYRSDIKYNHTTCYEGSPNVKITNSGYMSRGLNLDCSFYTRNWDTVLPH